MFNRHVKGATQITMKRNTSKRAGQMKSKSSTRRNGGLSGSTKPSGSSQGKRKKGATKRSKGTRY